MTTLLAFKTIDHIWDAVGYAIKHQKNISKYLTRAIQRNSSCLKVIENKIRDFEIAKKNKENGA
jgi:hypothetical protein